MPMTDQEKVQFINTAMEGLKNELLKSIPKMPQEWDGIELRWLIKDKASEFVWHDQSEHKGRRRKYLNECKVKNI